MLLFDSSSLQKLLYDIVPEQVRHQSYRTGQQGIEDELAILSIGTVQFRLNEPRSMLIPTELLAVRQNVTQLQFTGLRTSELFQ